MSFHCDEEEKHRQALLPTLGGDFPCDCRVYNAAAGVFSPLHSMKSYEVLHRFSGHNCQALQVRR